MRPCREDFFYRVPQNLTFDGVFEFFPHPMYTVGYSMYYGAALLTNSYEVLFVTLFVHGCQLAFLVRSSCLLATAMCWRVYMWVGGWVGGFAHVGVC
jgi:hypothetical protein